MSRLIILQLALLELTSLRYLHHLFLCQAQVHVFGLQVSMDDFANAVQEIKTDKALSSHLSNDWQRSPFVIVSFDHFEQVDSQDFKHRHKVLAVGSMVQEAVQQLHTIAIVACNVM